MIGKDNPAALNHLCPFIFSACCQYFFGCGYPVCFFTRNASKTVSPILTMTPLRFCFIPWEQWERRLAINQRHRQLCVSSEVICVQNLTEAERFPWNDINIKGFLKIKGQLGEYSPLTMHPYSHVSATEIFSVTPEFPFSFWALRKTYCSQFKWIQEDGEAPKKICEETRLYFSGINSAP